jgi:hypothetical protein
MHEGMVTRVLNATRECTNKQRGAAICTLPRKRMQPV